MRQNSRQMRPEVYGALLVLLSALFFTLMALLVRSARDSFRPDTMVFYRALIQAACLTPWIRLYFQPGPAGTLRERLPIHLLRGAFGVAAMYCYYQGLSHLPLAISCLLGTTSVLWATLLTRIFLKERSSFIQIAFAVLACVGVSIGVLRFGEVHSSWTVSVFGLSFGFLGAAFRGGALTALRKLRRNIGSREIVFFLSLTSAAAMAPLFFSQPEVPRNLSEWGIIFGIGVSATVGQLLLTAGFRYTSTLVATTCTLQSTLLGAFLGFLFLGELPPIQFFFGTALMMAGTVGLVRSKGHTPTLPGGANAV